MIFMGNLWIYSSGSFPRSLSSFQILLAFQLDQKLAIIFNQIMCSANKSNKNEGNLWWLGASIFCPWSEFGVLFFFWEEFWICFFRGGGEANFLQNIKTTIMSLTASRIKDFDFYW